MPLVIDDKSFAPPQNAPNNVSNAAINKLSVERLAVQLDNMPPLPEIATRVLKIFDDPNADISDLEILLSRDPVLSAKVFKLANSAFYSRGHQSQTLHDACTLLGMNTLKNVIMACCVGQIASNTLRQYVYLPKGMWKHSLSTALASVSIATAMSLDRRFKEELFLAALVHDIGKLLLDQILDSPVSSVGHHSIALESQAVGITHTQVGVEIAQRWKLPAYVNSVIGEHHSPGHTTAHESHVSLVHMVDWMLNNHRVGLKDDCLIDDSVDPASLEVLTLNKADFEELQILLIEKLPEVDNVCSTLV